MRQDRTAVIPDLAHDVRALVREGLLNARLLDRELQPTANEERGHSSRDRIGVSNVATLALLACAEALSQVGATAEWQEMPNCLVAPTTPTVFSELIDNALRFEDPERTLRVVVDGQIREEGVRVKVADNGMSWRLPAGSGGTFVFELALVRKG